MTQASAEQPVPVPEIAAACTALGSGGLIAYPTEGVFGIGCDIRDPLALERVRRIKQRTSGKGFIVIGSSVEQILPLLKPPTESEMGRLHKAWPGPVTFVANATAGLPELLTGGRETIAVRVSAHPVVAQLCNHYAKPILSTSANLSGHPPMQSARAVRSAFGEAIEVIIDAPVGNLEGATPIFDLRTGRQLR